MKGSKFKFLLEILCYLPYVIVIMMLTAQLYPYMPTSQLPPIDEMTFEQAMLELENLVRRLEEGRLPLEEAISAFERGASLKQHCEKRLLNARMRVDQINPDGTRSQFDAQ
jgi:exodeoxyribonuclease VII small subunit